MPKCLDLFAGAGGTGMGYYLAGYEVIGVDHREQPNYPFEFHQEDVMKMDLAQIVRWEGFDLIHASPPCQSYSANTMHLAYPQPKLIEPLREMFVNLPCDYVIENVNGAPLLPEKTIMLCGTMFGKRIWRHRLFESNFPLAPHPWKCDHSEPSMNLHNTIGRRGLRIKDWLKEMEVYIYDQKLWMTQKEAKQAIPPYYTEFIGLQLAQAREEVKAQIA
jgi:DNA (cytosine-5)-methyltransferase 1